MKKILKFLFMVCIFVFNFSFVSSLSTTVYVPEKYNEISAGERIYFEIDLKYPENPKRKDVELVYEIKDLKEKMFVESQVLRAVENQASFIDFLVTPESMKEGTYKIEIKIFEYGKYLGKSSSTFYLVKSKSEIFKRYFYILLSGILFIAIIVVLDFLRKRRKI